MIHHLASNRAAVRGRNAERDLHDEKRKNDTHSSTRDHDARLVHKALAKRPSSATWGI